MFKRGDRLYYINRYGDIIKRKGMIVSFRYRMDPVPYSWVYHGWFRNWYKRPKTTQERRWSFADSQYIRVKRICWNLPNTWDDRKRGDIGTRRSWKNKKIKKQWMKNL